MPAVAPFPFDRWERLPTVAVGPLRAAARAARAPQGWASALEAVRSVLGAPLHVGLVDVRWMAAGRPRETAGALVALRVELPLGTAILELDPSGAIALVEATLGTDRGPEADGAAHRPLRDAELGVLAYLAACFVNAARPSGGRLLGWTTDPRLLAAVLSGQDFLALRLDLFVDGRVFAACLWLPARTVLPPAPPPDLARFAHVPVAVRADVGVVVLSASDLAGLSLGDVVLLDSAVARPGAKGPTGAARLRPVGARAPWFSGEIVDARSIRVAAPLIAEEVVPMDPTETKQRAETSPAGASLGPLAADIPIEVVVELGRATLSVGTLAALAPGEVVLLDRGPTDPVTLTAGPRVLARGELVVVDGQVGVRILEAGR